jgi:hypothetical protein
MKTIAKFMSVASFSVAFAFFAVMKGGIGEIDVPADFRK